MSTVLRGRRIRYDNIAQGSALTTPEKVITGQSVTVIEIYGGGFCTSTSTGEAWQNNVKAGASTTDELAPGAMQENIVVANTTDIQQENVKAGG
jgi:hypothetical protein